MSVNIHENEVDELRVWRRFRDLMLAGVVAENPGQSDDFMIRQMVSAWAKLRRSVRPELRHFLDAAAFMSAEFGATTDAGRELELAR